ncbi:MAG: phosphoribosylformylglycinamidine synthase [Desulfovibrio sp.]|jgi:phosphoribosylformylglycinamidine synthase|nr:phosphoribosylformylglycinamidine synthase [Desulfovibrio sp.]
MLITLETRLKNHLDDCQGRNLVQRIRAALGLEIEAARLTRAYIVDGLEREDLQKAVDCAALHDPVLQEAALGPFPTDADWIIEAAFRPGVTDNEGRTARDTLALVLGLETKDAISVYTATRYHLKGVLSRPEVESIARDFLVNELIQRYSLKSGAQWRQEPGFAARAAKVMGIASGEVRSVPLRTMTDTQMLNLSQKNTWALSLEELHAARAYFADPKRAEDRLGAGFPPELAADPTDAEMEVLAQTWSEHCKHKIFAARIAYENVETGRSEVIDSLYKSHIQAVTATIRERLGGGDFCRSVFKDNAGVVSFNADYDVCIKVETHNSPSALDPYGGALTGIVGVNRDPMGTGMGAELVCNTDVFCFASPFYKGELPPRILHPRRIMEGVGEGVKDGGNKSGIPTVNGSMVFDERFLGKPLVYCGTVGLLPVRIGGKPGYEKRAEPGDVIVMAGGRIGKDGIHGATFSSEELHEGSPATAVQIGDPITQRKLYDFIIRARNLGLYNAITDNGAGGLSSSVGEMAEDTGGCILDLARAPLKYDGLKPWEILLSEAQERMTLAVPRAKLEAFLELAGEMDVEAAALGEFTKSGYFHVTYKDTHVARLHMDFMHRGLPRLELRARWERPPAYPAGGAALKTADGRQTSPETAQSRLGLTPEALLLRMLGRLNICSKEYLIRQYDHEVKGGSVIKPLVGVLRDGPSDAAVLRPLLQCEAGLVLAHGICPKFSDADTYWMAANALDEAVRNAVAVGADPDRMAGVDNFCWCDPVRSDKTPDGEYKLAQLVRACMALKDFCLAYDLPCVSGKDSMKNDYTGGGVKISIPPTLLFSVLGFIPDVSLAVSSDFKKAGDAIYILGLSRPEFAGSEAAAELRLAGGVPPQVDAATARARYQLIHAAMRKRLVSACHDLSDGGLGVALAEMCIGGRIGACVDLDKVPHTAFTGERDDDISTSLLYSESASRLLLTVPKNNTDEFETMLGQSPGCRIGFDAARIGEVEAGGVLRIAFNGTVKLEAPVEDLARSFKATLDW